MRAVVTVREAVGAAGSGPGSRAAEAARREDLLRRALAGYHTQAFLYFFLQELTLQCSVLGGAVLFIFCGVRVGWCCVAVPAAAALLVALAVWAAHLALADKLVQGMRKEKVGLVAEYRGPLVAAADVPHLRVTIRPLYAHEDAEHDPETESEPVHTQIVGTVSVSEFWGPRNSGWMHALAVDPQWRGRGVGGALVAGCRARGAREGLASLEAVVTQLQHAARRLLHHAGWEMRATYQRPVVGAALTLPVAHLGTDLPLA